MTPFIKSVCIEFTCVWTSQAPGRPWRKTSCRPCHCKQTQLVVGSHCLSVGRLKSPEKVPFKLSILSRNACFFFFLLFCFLAFLFVDQTWRTMSEYCAQLPVQVVCLSFLSAATGFRYIFCVVSPGLESACACWPLSKIETLHFNVHWRPM